MATEAPTQQQLPLLYSALEPLSSSVHGKMKIKTVEKAPVIATTHAIPATVDEFPLLARHYPIIFAVGDTPVPLAWSKTPTPTVSRKVVWLPMLNELSRPVAPVPCCE